MTYREFGTGQTTRYRHTITAESSKIGDDYASIHWSPRPGDPKVDFFDWFKAGHSILDHIIPGEWPQGTIQRDDPDQYPHDAIFSCSEFTPDDAEKADLFGQ